MITYTGQYLRRIPNKGCINNRQASLINGVVNPSFVLSALYNHRSGKYHSTIHSAPLPLVDETLLCIVSHQDVGTHASPQFPNLHSSK